MSDDCVRDASLAGFTAGLGGMTGASFPTLKNSESKGLHNVDLANNKNTNKKQNMTHVAGAVATRDSEELAGVPEPVGLAGLLSLPSLW